MDRIESKIGAIESGVGARIDRMEASFTARMDRVEDKIERQTGKLHHAPFSPKTVLLADRTSSMTVTKQKLTNHLADSTGLTGRNSRALVESFCCNSIIDRHWAGYRPAYNPGFFGRSSHRDIETTRTVPCLTVTISVSWFPEYADTPPAERSRPIRPSISCPQDRYFRVDIHPSHALTPAFQDWLSGLRCVRTVLHTIGRLKRDCPLMSGLPQNGVR